MCLESYIQATGIFWVGAQPFPCPPPNFCASFLIFDMDIVRKMSALNPLLSLFKILAPPLIGGAERRLTPKPLPQASRSNRYDLWTIIYLPCHTSIPLSGGPGQHPTNLFWFVTLPPLSFNHVIVTSFPVIRGMSGELWVIMTRHKRTRHAKSGWEDGGNMETRGRFGESSRISLQVLG